MTTPENSLPSSSAELYSHLTEADLLESLERSESHQGLEPVASPFFPRLMESEDAELVRANNNGEYRGWYGTRDKPRWCPQQSKYGARGGDHKGADIFALRGTRLVALVDGNLQWNPQGDGGAWGNHVWLNFRHHNNNFTFVYAHLDSLIGNAPRRVTAGEVICTSGCTGNTTYCGVENQCGGREDHVHLELFGPSGRMDPIAALGWNLRYADDTRCLYPNCKRV